jgi:hypothetical protein
MLLGGGQGDDWVCAFKRVILYTPTLVIKRQPQKLIRSKADLLENNQTSLIVLTKYF